MSGEVNFSRDAAEYIEASYTHHPVDDMEPEIAEIWAPSNEALALAVRYHARLESRPYGVVAQEVGLHPETIRRAVRKLSERLGVRCPAQRSLATSEKCRQAQLGHPKYNGKNKSPSKGEALP
jgi:hypothetical protein